MHELSIADAIVRIACAHAGGRRIESVEVKVGHLRQVVPDALAFAFTLVAEGTERRGRRAADGRGARRRRLPRVRVRERTARLPAGLRGAAGAWMWSWSAARSCSWTH